MCSGVRSGLGPPGSSLRRENSAQGGADHINPIKPDQQRRCSTRKKSSCKMLCFVDSGVDRLDAVEAQSRAAALSGAVLPEKRSRSSRGGLAVPCEGILTEGLASSSGPAQLLVQE